MVAVSIPIFVSPRITCPKCLGTGKAEYDGECALCGGEKMVQPFTRDPDKKTCKEHKTNVGYLRKSGPGWSFRCGECFAFVEVLSKYEVGESKKPPTSRKGICPEQ